ncbi:unnamed protein product, partial [Allacma fusca]
SNQSELEAKADVLAELELAKTENSLVLDTRTGRKRTSAGSNQPSSSKESLKANNSTNPSKRLSRAAEIDTILENIDSSNNNQDEIEDQTLQLQVAQNDQNEEQIAASSNGRKQVFQIFCIHS